jgi:hypothetical protein
MPKKEVSRRASRGAELAENTFAAGVSIPGDTLKAQRLDYDLRPEAVVIFRRRLTARGRQRQHCRVNRFPLRALHCKRSDFCCSDEISGGELIKFFGAGVTSSEECRERAAALSGQAVAVGSWDLLNQLVSAK